MQWTHTQTQKHAPCTHVPRSGVGAYSDSRGAEGVRKEVAAYIGKRDGYPADPDVRACVRVCPLNARLRSSVT